MSCLKVLTNGILKENPVFVMLLGLCPSLAVTTLVSSGIGMGLAASFVLLGSNIVISLLRRVIPKQVRLPAYITVIAGFVTIISLFMEKYLPDLNQTLGVYLSLIVVNCIILARAEVFAGKNGVVRSACDALGMGIGFTLALLAISSVRELLGSGSWFGIPLTKNFVEPMTFFVTPAGGFFVLGILIAFVNKLTKYTISKKSTGCIGCKGCPGREEAAR